MYYQETKDPESKGKIKQVDPKVECYNDYFMIQPEVEDNPISIISIDKNSDGQEQYLPKEMQRIAAVGKNSQGFKVGDVVNIANSANPLGFIYIDDIMYVIYRTSSIVCKVSE